jgi:glycosyltransferase involved in cell wall biosynthesis
MTASQGPSQIPLRSVGSTKAPDHQQGPPPPLISILLPVLNCERTIGLAIASILNQTRADWELLLIDDGSTDKTVDVVRSFADARIRVFCDEQRQSLPARLNEGVRRAQGKYIARMDGDDVMYPDRLATQVAYLDVHPETDLVGGGMVIFRNEGEAYGARIFPATHAEICRHPWLRLPVSHPTWMGQAEWFRANPYEEWTAGNAEDRELLFRTCCKSRFANLPDVVLGYRENGVTLTKRVLCRRSVLRMLIRSAGREITYRAALLGCAAQCLGLIAELIAIVTGLDKRVLRHRAPPTTDAVVETWRGVWALNRKSAKDLVRT